MCDVDVIDDEAFRIRTQNKIQIQNFAKKNNTGDERDENTFKKQKFRGN